jgi:hypothetical protein
VPGKWAERAMTLAFPASHICISPLPTAHSRALTERLARGSRAPSLFAGLTRRAARYVGYPTSRRVSRHRRAVLIAAQRILLMFMRDHVVTRAGCSESGSSSRASAHLALLEDRLRLIGKKGGPVLFQLPANLKKTLSASLHS